MDLHGPFPGLPTSPYQPNIKTRLRSFEDQEELFLQDARSPGLTTTD